MDNSPEARAAARQDALDHGVDDSASAYLKPSYGLDPDSDDPDHWIRAARRAQYALDSRSIGWMWRWCPDVVLRDGRRLVEVIDAIGGATCDMQGQREG